MSIASIPFKITVDGLNEAFALGSLNLTVDYVQFGTGNKTPNGTEHALLIPEESALITTHHNVATGQHRIGAVIGGSLLTYDISEIGLWSGVPGSPGSVLVFYWALPSGSIAVKSPSIDFNFETDLFFGGVVPANITIVADTEFNSLGMIAAHNAREDAHEAMAETITTIVHTTNDPGQQAFRYTAVTGNPITISSGNSVTRTEKVYLTGMPTGTTGVILRARLNSNYGGNGTRSLSFRKNSSEPFAMKIAVDPMHHPDFDTIFSPGFTETENYATFLLDFDTSDNSFELQFGFNSGGQAFGGTVLEAVIDLWQEGWLVPRRVLVYPG